MRVKLPEKSSMTQDSTKRGKPGQWTLAYIPLDKCQSEWFVSLAIRMIPSQLASDTEALTDEVGGDSTKVYFLNGYMQIIQCQEKSKKTQTKLRNCHNFWFFNGIPNWCPQGRVIFSNVFPIKLLFKPIDLTTDPSIQCKFQHNLISLRPPPPATYWHLYLTYFSRPENPIFAPLYVCMTWPDLKCSPAEVIFVSFDC